MKLNKHKGYSFYDVIISLMILILASVYVTKIFVGAVEVNNKNTIINACTFEAIETIENLKSLGSFTNYKTNEYLQSFQKLQNESGLVYSRNFEISDKYYLERVTLEVVEDYRIDKLTEAKVYSTQTISELKSETMVNTLYQVTVQILNEKNEEVYLVKTYFTESHKVLE